MFYLFTDHCPTDYDRARLVDPYYAYGTERYNSFSSAMSYCGSEKAGLPILKTIEAAASMYMVQKSGDISSCNKRQISFTA